MPDTSTNYWGEDFPPANDSVAIELLKQQASKLGDVTHGAVVGVVEENAEGGTTFASLYLAVPAADDYRFKILYIAYPIVADPANPFPIAAEDSFSKDKKTFTDMAEFDNYLHATLSSKQVRSAVSNMVKYSKARQTV